MQHPPVSRSRLCCVPTGRITVVLAKEAQRTRRSPRAGGANEPNVVVYIHQDSADPEQCRLAPTDQRGRRWQRYGAESNVLVRQHEQPASQEWVVTSLPDRAPRSGGTLAFRPGTGQRLGAEWPTMSANFKR